MKRYKNFFNLLATLIIVLLFGLLLIPMAQADDKSVTFAWDYPTDYDQITHWKLYWGTQAGGPYETGEAQINKSMLGSTTQTDIVIQYPPNAKTTYYYVLVAFKDELYSANSNEVSVEGDFRENPLAPLQLRVILSGG